MGGSLSEDGSKDGWTDDPGVHNGPLGLSTGDAALFCSNSSLYIRTFRFFPDSFLSNKLGLNALVVMLIIAHVVYIYTQIIVIVICDSFFFVERHHNDLSGFSIIPHSLPHTNQFVGVTVKNLRSE